MRLAIQESVTSATAFADKLETAHALGFQGLEVNWLSVLERLDEMQAALESSSVCISTVCGSGRHDILCLDRGEREGRLAEIRRLLDGAAALGAVGLIIVPIRTGARFPDLSPYLTDREIMTGTAVAILKDLAGHAAERGVSLLLEPLIRYETPFIRRLDEAVAICEAVNSPGLALMADFFHMHTEEADPPTAIRQAGRWLKHIHLADSNRMTPGSGHTDFAGWFGALSEIGFTGFMALECGFGPDRLGELKRTTRFLQDAIGAARR